MTRFDLSSLRGLYAILDPEQTNGRDPRETAEAILRGGCAVLQLRAKVLPDDELLPLARDVSALCNKAAVPFFVNDRADIAVLADADGVHLGQGDLPLRDARIVVGARFVGRSTHDLAQVAAEAGADMLGFGPVFPTDTKATTDAVVGIELLRQAVQLASVPVVAIGGITFERLDAVLATGVPLVAAISAITRAEDVEASARAMHERIRDAKG